MTIAITGAKGQLGKVLCDRFGDQAIPFSYPYFDLTDRDTMTSMIRRVQPTMIINAAAFTAVDKAETEGDRCQAVNAQGVSDLALLCAEMDIPLVQISTDYVYEQTENGRVPFRETDVPVEPEGIYARTKFEGEVVARQWQKHFIVRTCGLYALHERGPVRGRNFVDTMLLLGQERDELKIVNDQQCTPTHIPDLADAIVNLTKTEAYGTYHVTNSGDTNWCEFAEEIFRLAELDVRVEPISTEQYNAPAPRPRYSVLDLNKYRDLTCHELPTWKQGLGYYVEQALAHNA